MYLFTYYDGDCTFNVKTNHTAYKCWILRLTWKQSKKLNYQGDT